MKILVDTDRIIAALVKEGTTRRILLDEYFDFVTPDHTLEEIEEHREELQKKTKLSGQEFETVLTLLFESITIIPKEGYASLLEECKSLIDDVDDVPHLAACLATHAEGIWAHDPHFLKQKRAKVFTNIDLLRISGTANDNKQG